MAYDLVYCIPWEITLIACFCKFLQTSGYISPMLESPIQPVRSQSKASTASFRLIKEQYLATSWTNGKVPVPIAIIWDKPHGSNDSVWGRGHKQRIFLELVDIVIFADSCLGNLEQTTRKFFKGWIAPKSNNSDIFLQDMVQTFNTHQIKPFDAKQFTSGTSD